MRNGDDVAVDLGTSVPRTASNNPEPSSFGWISTSTFVMVSPSYTLGLVFIVLVSLIWAAASVLVQFLYTDDKMSFDSPFLLTYCGVSLFTSLLPLQCLLDGWKRKNNPPSLENPSDIQYQPYHDHQRQEDVEQIATTPESFAPQGLTKRPWTREDHMWAAAKIAPVWFISNYSYNASLLYTSITSSTVLASTGSLFTFLFALLWKDEHFSWIKILGILLGMTGSIVTGIHDLEHGDESSDSEKENDDLAVWGDFLGLLSAVGYGGYAVMVRILCPHDESLMSMQVFLGYVGLWNMLFLSPIALYQIFVVNTGLTWIVLGLLIIKGLLDNVLSDYLWARAVVLTSATVATVGLGLTIPLAFASDVLLGRPDVLDVSSIGGALAVLAGFVLVNIGQSREENQCDEREYQSHPSPLGHELTPPPQGAFAMSMEYRDTPSELDEMSDSSDGG